MSFYHTKPIRFRCSQCSQCCYGDKYAYVRVKSQEIEAIRSHLNMDTQSFEDDYLIKLIDHGYGIRMTKNLINTLLNKPEHCVFLNKEGKCSIYSVRPTQCCTYPFWPEILINEETWNNEVTRCEGINQGDEVNVKHIEKQKKLSVDTGIIIND